MLPNSYFPNFSIAVTLVFGLGLSSRDSLADDVNFHHAGYSFSEEFLNGSGISTEQVFSMIDLSKKAYSDLPAETRTTSAVFSLSHLKKLDLSLPRLNELSAKIESSYLEYSDIDYERSEPEYIESRKVLLSYLQQFASRFVLDQILSEHFEKNPKSDVILYNFANKNVALGDLNLPNSESNITFTFWEVDSSVSVHIGRKPFYFSMFDLVYALSGVSLGEEWHKGYPKRGLPGDISSDRARLEKIRQRVLPYIFPDRLKALVSNQNEDALGIVHALYKRYQSYQGAGDLFFDVTRFDSALDLLASVKSGYTDSLSSTMVLLHWLLELKKFRSSHPSLDAQSATGEPNQFLLWPFSLNNSEFMRREFRSPIDGEPLIATWNPQRSSVEFYKSEDVKPRFRISLSILEGLGVFSDQHLRCEQLLNIKRIHLDKRL